MLSTEASAMARRIEIIRLHQDRVRRALRAQDTILSVATPAEAAASVTSRVDSGRVWNGDAPSMLTALQSLSRDQRQAAFDELSNGASPQSVAERYLGSATGWATAANGTVFSQANNLGSRTEQGTADATLRHLDADRQRDTLSIRAMQRANRASR